MVDRVRGAVAAKKEGGKATLKNGFGQVAYSLRSTKKNKKRAEVEGLDSIQKQFTVRNKVEQTSSISKRKLTFNSVIKSWVRNVSEVTFETRGITGSGFRFRVQVSAPERGSRAPHTARTHREELGCTNSVEDQLHLDTSLKKEVARWYQLIMDTIDGEFTLPKEVWKECLPEPHFKDL
ncbi:hypothetical protein NDU88_004493 [Pleurodeles waltl]|uniref:Uncharacterized protein n=1 Tax=Pleurodeles waltl TaxID=8319 RepID=A0AAV7T8I9_PLEWA|nr:hypothetical protein NDU88_004493 [Pleurodeles waltl]